MTASPSTLILAHKVAGLRPFHYPGGGKPLACEQVSLEALAAEHGTPLYVYSADQIVQRLRIFQQALGQQALGQQALGAKQAVPAERQPLVCYAVKANSALAILKELAAHGAGFDIVSGGELERVLAAAPEAVGRVVFSGVGKTAAEIDRALEVGILAFNVESESELSLLAERADSLKRKARFALRVNPDVFAETHPYISTGLSEHKFGIEIGQARRIYRQAAGEKWLEPYSVSVHIGSQIRSAEPFGAAMDRVAQLVRELADDGIRIQTVDAGGGLGIDYQAALVQTASDSGVAAAMDPEAGPVDRVAEYAAALRAALGDLDVRLLVEPGRFLVAQAGALLARVLSVKRNGQKTFVVIDAAMNDLIRPALYQAHHEIVAVLPRSGESKVVDLVGPVCETGDFLARDRQMPPLQPGDLVAILDAGAYGMAQSSNYNTRPRPAEVLVTGAEHRLIRRRETLADLLAPEIC